MDTSFERGGRRVLRGDHAHLPAVAGRGLCGSIRGLRVFSVAGLLLCAACVATNGPPEDAVRQKIGFDLARLDAEGLRGPADGKVAVSYEFCIPDTPECKARVRTIDPSVRFMPGSRGRIGAGAGQCLCIGSTHQKDFARVLRSLAALPCIDRIVECHFE